MPKGVYDRAASAWKPKPKVEYPPELVAKVRELYEAGHTMREVAEQVGVSVKVLQTLMPRNGIERRKAIPRDQRGPNNGGWKGDEACYSSLHLRVIRLRGQPQECSTCGKNDPSLRYEWANLTGAYEDVTDYARMCLSCHRRFDAARRARTGKRTSPARREVV